MTRQVTVVNQQQEVEATIVLQGDVASIDANFKSTLEVLFRSYTGCVIQVTDIQAGSIRVTIKGSQQGIERLIERFEAGDLTDADGFPVESIRLLSEELPEEIEESNLWNKWNVVQEILRNSQKSRRLQNADLSDADLSGAKLSGADLSGADLSSTDLSGADLSSADLRGADLSSADLRGANLRIANLSGADLRIAHLSGADLWGANLSGANLSGANLNGANLRDAYFRGADLRGAKVENARFGQGLGFSNEEKQSLTERGAIFDDASGDRDTAYTPTRRSAE